MCDRTGGAKLFRAFRTLTPARVSGLSGRSEIGTYPPPDVSISRLFSLSVCVCVCFSVDIYFREAPLSFEKVLIP